MKLDDLSARALFYEFADTEDAFWSTLPEREREGWRRVAAYVERISQPEPASAEGAP